MDRRERWGDPEEALRIAMATMAAQMWTALPGIVVSFDPATCTAVIQPAIGGVQSAADGTLRPTTLPVLPDVPVVFQRGGGALLTFPVQEGDEALLVFSCRPIDAWVQSGGVQRPASARMHDLSDAFALIGPMSAPNVPGGISTTSVQLRSNDGSAVVDLNPSTHAISITAPGGLTINAPVVTLNAALAQGAPMGGGTATSTLIGPLNVTNDVTAAGKSVSTHHHTEHDGPSTSTPI